jgi:hypothetical protein
MLSKSRKILVLATLALGSANIVKADTWSFPFTFNYTEDTPISVQGSFITPDNNGPENQITNWNVDFTTQTTFGPLTLNLNNTNSNFQLAPGTTVRTDLFTPPVLLINLADQSQGFDLDGTATVMNGNGNEDEYLVDWTVGEFGANASIVTIKSATGLNITSGQQFPDPGTYPVEFESDPGSLQVGVGEPSPVPEPSSLIMLGTGIFSISAAGIAKLKNIQRE